MLTKCTYTLHIAFIRSYQHSILLDWLHTSHTNPYPLIPEPETQPGSQVLPVTEVFWCLTTAEKMRPCRIAVVASPFLPEHSDNFGKLRPFRFHFLIQTLLVTRFALEKKDYTAALAHTCSPRVTLTHMLLSVITIKTASAPLKKRKSAMTNNTTPTLCANVSRVGVYVCVRRVCMGVLRDMGDVCRASCCCCSFFYAL